VSISLFSVARPHKPPPNDPNWRDFVTYCGDTVTASWNTSLATSVSISPPVTNAALPTSGSANTTALRSTTYTLTAQGPHGPVTASASIQVQGAPTITSLTSPDVKGFDPVPSNAPVHFSWTTENANRCTITIARKDGIPSPHPTGVSQDVPTNGTFQYPAADGIWNLTLTAYGPVAGSEDTKNITWTVGTRRNPWEFPV
jgi:hypothetical protein